MRRSLIVALVLALLAPRVLPAQERGATALRELVDGLPVTARVLMIGAHPDDEDTQLIAWLSRGRHVETAYLSLTRGDGGQNLIGNELGEALGVLRTEELLAARRIDGARQYFTRAYDFGFSKSVEETFRHWPKDSLLKDVVEVIRLFRPHVIISVFSGTPRDGHGQHQAAGVLAREAFDVAGDSTKFDDQLIGSVRSWRSLKFYRSARFSPETATLRLNVGEYSPLLGRSYAEIAAESRSQHKSQAFGALQRKGVTWAHVRLEASHVSRVERAGNERSLFDGVDTTWARLRALAPAVDWIAPLLDSALAIGAVGDMRRAAAVLARLSARARAVEEGVRCLRSSSCSQAEGDVVTSVRVLRDRASRASLIAAGVAIEATVPRETWATGDTVPITITVYNRGPGAIAVAAGGGLTGPDLVVRHMGVSGVPIDPDSSAQFTVTALARQHTYPPWLASPRRGDMFGLVEHDRDARTRLRLHFLIGNERLEAVEPVIYRFADPVRGEVRRPVAVVNGLSIRLERAVATVPADAQFDRLIRAELRSGMSVEQRFRLFVSAPPGVVAVHSTEIVLAPFERRLVGIRLTGRLPGGSHSVDIVGQAAPYSFTAGYEEIDYEHIRRQRMYRHSTLVLNAFDVVVPTVVVGYISGVGDNVLPALRELGVDVTAIDPATVATADLSRFATIVVGPRAYESNPQLAATNARLLEYVRRGGRLVVQYGQYEMMQPGMMPYPVAIARPHDRVTEEDSPVTMLGGTVLTGPNLITQRDWDGWVQERSLYMPRSFDARYVPVVEMRDPGEQPNRGGLLVAKYGEGTYVYTTLAFFRQLPAGVPGATRLFLNMLVADASSIATSREAP